MFYFKVLEQNPLVLMIIRSSVHFFNSWKYIFLVYNLKIFIFMITDIVYAYYFEIANIQKN